MSTSLISSDRIFFEVEARLLQELGERLVASPDVALLELIKNSCDADAPECRVMLTERFGKPNLVIADNGAGMTEKDFRDRWMRIAADSKRESLTKRFGRPVTGQKGIGRFAIRYLGGAVKLTSVAFDPEHGELRKLTAVFDWKRLDRAIDLKKASVSYWVNHVPDGTPTGTVLTVSRLKQDLNRAVAKPLLSSILEIVSPISTFDLGPFSNKRGETLVVPNVTEPAVVDGDAKTEPDEDPGFRVLFVGFPALDEERSDIAKAVIDNCWARLTISLAGQTLTYRVKFKGESNIHRLSFPYLNSISKGLHADIAFAPKRKGSFNDLGPDGRDAWSWIRKNSGVGVVDNGFRIRPYGFEDDDWLYLNQDAAHNRRTWRSRISIEQFPQSSIEEARPAINAALNVATNFQLVGAVGVASRASNSPAEKDLIPAMDREGFLHNEAYDQMVEVVRGGIEYLASLDKARQLKALEVKALRERDELRSDLAETIDDIREDPRLADEEKAALVQHYSALATRVVEQEQYDRDARQRLEIASGLGIVAGFMTHEAERLFLALDSVIDKLAKRARTPAELADLKQVRESRSHLDSYIRYTRLYTESLRSGDLKAFSALGQIEWVVDHFGPTAHSRGIKTIMDCAEDVLAPPVPVAMYSAVLLNLYTNATKAIIAKETRDEEPKILISAWNDPKNHYLSVQDTGVGIPPSSQKRIWDPFFTTTSRVNSPLGSGMGLGLSLVRDLVERQGGKAQLSKASPAYQTCIQVSLPRKMNGH